MENQAGNAVSSQMEGTERMHTAVIYQAGNIANTPTDQEGGSTHRTSTDQSGGSTSTANQNTPASQIMIQRDGLHLLQDDVVRSSITNIAGSDMSGLGPIQPPHTKSGAVQVGVELKSFPDVSLLPDPSTSSIQMAKWPLGMYTSKSYTVKLSKNVGHTSLAP